MSSGVAGKERASIDRRGTIASCNCISKMPAHLVWELLAGVNIRFPELYAFVMVHCTLANDFGKQEVGNRLDFPLRQGCGSVRDGQSARLYIGLLHAETAAVTIGKLVKCRHVPTWPNTFYGLDQLFAVELGLAQIRPIGHLAVHFSAVAGPAVACLTVSLLPIKPRPRHNI